jgi:hypothetical protein
MLPLPVTLPETVDDGLMLMAPVPAEMLPPTVPLWPVVRVPLPLVDRLPETELW